MTRAGQARPGGSPLSSDDHAVNAVAFSPDGRWIAAGGDTQAGVWDLASRSLTATLPHPQKVASLTWDGSKELITGGGDGVVRAWALPSPVLLTGSPVSTVALSRLTGLLAAGGNQLQLWDPRTRQLLAARPAPGTGQQVSAVAFAPDSPLLAAGYSNGTFRLWDADRPPGARGQGGPRVHAEPGRVDRVQPGRQGAGHRRGRRHAAAVGRVRPGAAPAARDLA